MLNSGVSFDCCEALLLLLKNCLLLLILKTLCSSEIFTQWSIELIITVLIKTLCTVGKI